MNEVSSDGELIGCSGNFFIGDLVVCSGVVFIGVRLVDGKVRFFCSVSKGVFLCFGCVDKNYYIGELSWGQGYE